MIDDPFSKLIKVLRLLSFKSIFFRQVALNVMKVIKSPEERLECTNSSAVWSEKREQTVGFFVQTLAGRMFPGCKQLLRCLKIVAFFFVISFVFFISPFFFPEIPFLLHEFTPFLSETSSTFFVFFLLILEVGLACATRSHTFYEASAHIVKVIKQEAKAERKALDIAVKELADIQRMQKNSIKVCNASLAHVSFFSFTYRRRPRPTRPTLMLCAPSTSRSWSTSPRAPGMSGLKQTCRWVTPYSA